MTPLAAFITGLTTGGLTCFAVQGGLLLGLLARRQEGDERLSHWQRLFLPVSAFLIAKAIAYALLGFGLGWLGNKIQLTDTARIWLQSAAGIFMVISGIKLIFPQWLPWLSFQPPAGVRRFIRRSARSQAIVAPAILGFLTILIPCGTTQAMEVAAIASGAALSGAGIMLAFVLGTAPLFLLIGILAKGTTLLQRRLSYAAATIVIGLGLYTLNGVLVLVDSPYSVQNEVAALRATLSSGETAEVSSNPVITVAGNGYSPSQLTVPAGQPVTLTLNTTGNLGCTSIFVIPKLNIRKNLPDRGTTIVAANFPESGRYSFTCGMGMYTGTIEAI
jgi:sulfite exporter TauE/SafE